MKVLLACEYYLGENPSRNGEIDFCLKKNLSNTKIDSILVLFEDNSLKSKLKDPKIIPKKIKKRSRYSDFIDFYNRSEFDILILVNSDIYILEKDVNLILKNITEETVYALSRWDLNKDGESTHHDNWGSQDTWVFKGKVKEGDYELNLGIPGCDNRIAYLLHKAGYIVKNPSKDIKTYHYHLSDYRTYDNKFNKVEGEYFFINTTKINE